MAWRAADLLRDAMCGERVLARSTSRIWLAAVLAAGAVVPAAHAADIAVPAQSFPWSPIPVEDLSNRWEARFGVFAHGLKGHEQGTFDLNGEVVTPRLFPEYTGFWGPFIPRLHAGGSFNVDGRSSFAYTGLLWTADITESVFFNIFVGPSVHNGSLSDPPPTMQALGCRALVHAGLSLGYRFRERWSVLATYEHLSNASSWSGCPHNQALDNVGLRLGYAF